MGLLKSVPRSLECFHLLDLAFCRYSHLSKDLQFAMLSATRLSLLD